VIGASILYPWLVIVCSVPLLMALGAVLYLTVKYSPVIARIFETQPFFMPLKVKPVDRGEPVDFMADDGLRLRGTYLRARTEDQAGVIVYAHEFLSDRWSFQPYLEHLRDLGFSLFTFDFRNHGTSDLDPDYAPLQWTTEHEIHDLRGALAYLRTRDDHDPAGFGLFGVSRGGTTTLIVAAAEPDVWGVITDGAFPTQGTMVAYMVRWAQIYVRSAFLRGLIPMWLFGFLAWRGRLGTERSLNCRFPSVEAAVARLAPRPWLMIHGERDTYIGPEIARNLFDQGDDPQELWLVPNAKHNRCRETAPDDYAEKVLSFLERYAPRRPLRAPAEIMSRHSVLTSDFAHTLVPSALAREVATPISG
jgi:pimeloyl-ACP methyl ester carboxylesterase